jgi:hypothetical protein
MTRRGNPTISSGIPSREIPSTELHTQNQEKKKKNIGMNKKIGEECEEKLKRISAEMST